MPSDIRHDCDICLVYAAIVGDLETYSDLIMVGLDPLVAFDEEAVSDLQHAVDHYVANPPLDSGEAKAHANRLFILGDVKNFISLKNAAPTFGDAPCDDISIAQNYRPFKPEM